MELVWEFISGIYIGHDGRSYKSVSIQRAKVPGGWIIRLIYGKDSGGLGGLTFYPDPLHKWDGNSLP
ncbi:MAG: hypothetical protein K9M99_07245 [Candidatus Cloacimonetes bacterium]|nr:hypothetical protein [Candidatus Cloacimonadota bacterium]